MNDLDSLDLMNATTAPNPGAPAPRTCRPHRWEWTDWMDDQSRVLSRVEWCARCHRLRDAAVSRRSRNNRKRGNAAELEVARAMDGRKVGPLGHPWDVETPLLRVSVKKLATPPSLRFAITELHRVSAAPGPQAPAFVWIEPGRGGERLIVLRLDDFAALHGDPLEEEPR